MLTEINVHIIFIGVKEKIIDKFVPACFNDNIPQPLERKRVTHPEKYH